jgi:putative thiazole-containing bacteriocin maturation protein
MMRPKLKGDTFYMPVEDGIYLRNNRGQFWIKGKAVSRWMERLAPYFNGHYTLEEITEGLDPEKQEMVTNLVGVLTTNQFLKDTSHDLAHTLSPTELETYASEIAFIDSFSDSAASRFEHFREQQVLVIGSGLTLTGLVHAGLKCGVRQLAVITTQECETDTHRHRDYLDLFHKGDPRQELREIEAPHWEDEAEVLATLQPFDTILHISDRPMLARARRLNQLCVTHTKNFIQALVVENRAWIGPLVCSGSKGCWECAWRRLQANLTNRQEQFSSYAFQDQATAPLSRFVALPTATFIANQLAFEIFKYVTQAGPLTTADSLIEIDLETLRSQKHPFLPHPLCSACHHPVPYAASMFLETIDQLERGEPLNSDQFSERVAPCFEKRLGLFSSLDEEDFPQLPLSVCQAVVSSPLSQENLDDASRVIGVGTDSHTARRHAALRACEIYAASLVDRRLLLSSDACQGKTIPVDRFLSTSPLAGSKEWTWAIDLQTGQACLVPASLVYPTLRGLSPLSEAGLGIASGMSWVEAVGQAMLNLCRHLTITQLGKAQKSYPLVDLAVTPLEPEGIRQRHIVDLIGEALTVYDVTDSSLQVPTFAFCLREKTVAYSTHLDVAQALYDGLEQTTLHWQISREQSVTPHGPTVPNLPTVLRGDTKVIPQFTAPKLWPDRKQWLQQTLEKNGWSAFATPLDQDPALSQVQPYIVHVLLASA